ncbi:copper chaperone PCu(A)C [Pseudomonas petrae]|uniref:Copper chaperone PCu(A)C n=1 Tax=Pseudomonas petrae TaxID=2912190 RepID=A0ABS9I9K5_9PSED|nr:copper chaperone PCu(A)C [Pseudomonas petrae]MCF7532711.1 copper chaperone PCu(A)C [Pseudomonas petrae]MCF7538872.1 copper chaperone PCu(A)C [Pseudomonas petrae]MCF7543711.1 copper chaperone PCu(A)C [Pseudomonas petrae]MCF7557084.1 copper chaperone PCu(A)C [Pseudomonas petrae]
MNALLNVRPRSFVSRTLVVALLAGVSLSAVAETRVEDPWVRATVAGQPSSGAFMRITADTDSTLLSVSSPVAKDVQIHEMSMTNDVMRMGPVDAVPLPAGKTVALDPEGYHVMLMGLNGQIEEGDQVPLTLTVKNAKGETEVVNVSAPARAAMAPMDMAHDPGMTH